MRVTQLSDVPYMGAPSSSYYVWYDQKAKTIEIDGNVIDSPKVVFDIICDIQRQLNVAPERGHHYDVFRDGDVVRIGIAGHNIGISRYDIPCLL